MSNKKILVAYFSHSGENYTDKGLAVLKKGNTAIVAKMAAELAGADCFELKPAEEYPFGYDECTKVAKKELGANYRPALAETIDTSAYDTIILGYPNWWGTMPMILFTFLESQKLAGKKLLPFCTNEGSGMGVSEKDLKKLCPDSSVCSGLPIRGSKAAASRPAVEKWLKENL